MAQNPMIGKAEDMADNVLRKTKFILPHLGRFCLVSTFVEDGIRMWVQWSEQRDYIASTWSCGAFLATMFVLINMVGQVGACMGVLIRKQVPIMCGILFFIIGLQTIAYSILWDLKFLARNMALVGAVLLLLAESKAESRSLFAGVPQLERNTPKSYMQLSGRVLLVLMFMTLLHFTFNPLDMLETFFFLVMLGFILIGYHEKISAIIILVTLNIANIMTNNFWARRSNIYFYSDLKSFFSVITVSGALIMLIVQGPGDISYKKYKEENSNGFYSR